MTNERKLKGDLCVFVSRLLRAGNNSPRRYISEIYTSGARYERERELVSRVRLLFAKKHSQTDEIFRHPIDTRREMRHHHRAGRCETRVWFKIPVWRILLARLHAHACLRDARTLQHEFLLLSEGSSSVESRASSPLTRTHLSSLTLINRSLVIRTRRSASLGVAARLRLFVNAMCTSCVAAICGQMPRL